MIDHIVEWYYNGIAGIQPREPGFGKVTIRPYLPEGMTEFTCSYRSVKGEIKVQVRQKEQNILLTVTVPEAVDCTVDTSNLETGGRKVVVCE